MNEELDKIINRSYSYTILATKRENKIAFVDEMRIVIDAYNSEEISISKVCEIINCMHLQKVQPKINLGKKPLGPFKKALLAVLWFFHNPNDRMSWDEAKHASIKHKCMFFGETVIIGCYKFRKCLHYGCKTLNPID